MNKIDLSDFFITKSQATDFSAKLGTIIDHMYTADFNFDKALTDQFGIHRKDLFLKLIRENNMTNPSTTAMQDLLKKIQETVRNMPVVSLMLAFEPTEETLKTFAQWFLFTLNMQVVFDIQTDTHLVAGIKITYNGKYKDYSLAPLFETTIKKVLGISQTTVSTQQPVQTPIMQQPIQPSIKN